MRIAPSRKGSDFEWIRILSVRYSSPYYNDMDFFLFQTLQKFTISAALLPSLQAEYCMERVTSRGVTGSKAKFVIDLPKHSLSFATKIQENFDTLEANLPSEASIDLPKVHVSAEYIQVK